MALSYVEITSNGQSSQNLSFSFDYLNQSDISVYVDGVLKSRPTDWDFNTSTTINFVSHPASGAVIRIERNTPATTRNVDFQDGSVLSEADLDNSANQIFFIAQEAKDTAESSVTVDPDGKWDAQNRVIKNVADPVNPQDAATKNYLENTWLTASDKAQLNSLNLTNLNTVATDISNVNTTAGDINNVNTVAGNISNVNAVAGNNTNITAVVNNATNINSAVSNTTNINTVATDITNVNTVSGSIANVNTVAGRDADIATVAARDANIGTVAARDADIGTVAGRDADIQTVANDLNEPVSEIDTVATNIANVNTVGNNISNVNQVAGIAANVTAVANDATDIGTVATNIASVQTVAGNDTNITTVAGISGDVTTVANNASNISTIASDIADVISVANDLQEATSEIDTVANNITNVNNVGNDIANVNTVAANITDVNNFADTYAISATAPTTPTPTIGDLWFDTTNNAMKVYSSSGWQAAGSSVNGTAQRNSYTATAGQTSFAATYDAGYVDVYLNGVKLIDGTDFTATNGTSVVLASGAAAGDTVDIVGYGTFQLSNFSINDANDVNAAGATTGQFLKWDGNNWVGDNVPAGVGGSNGADFNDNVKARFGTGNDLEIYHDGNDSYVDDAGTGALILRGNSNVTIGKHTGETMGFFEADGAVSLYHDNSIKLATTSTGVSVTDNIGIGTSSPNTYAGYSTLTLDHPTNGGVIDIERNGTVIGEIFANGANIFALQAMGTRSIEFKTNASTRMTIDSNGYVTKPNNPAFRVYYGGTNGGTNTLPAGKLQFNGAVTNVGSHFDLTNDRFVAPVAGFYHFDVIVFTYEHPGGTIPATTSMSVNLQVNGSIKVYTNYNYSASSARYEALSSSVGLYLNANDYVEAHTSRGSYCDNTGYYTQMSGHLVG